MRKTEIHKLASGAVAAAATAVGMICHADNPIIQTKFTADPAPMVSSNTVYLYTSHDDGQAYLYWGGNGPCYYVKLNEDMISVSGDIQVASIDFTGTPTPASASRAKPSAGARA